MKIRTQTVLAIAVLFAATCAFGIDTSRPRVKSIGILKIGIAKGITIDRTLRESLPPFLQEELTRAGFTATLLPATIAQMRDAKQSDAKNDILLEVTFAKSRGDSYGGVSAGVPVGGVGVGGEVSVVNAHAVAEIQVYNAKTLEPLDNLSFQSSATGPAVTGIGVGDGWFFFRIPIYPSGPFKEAARNLAKDAAKKIVEDFGSPRHQ